MPKTKHVVSHRTLCAETERYEVHAYCGVTEEASGSGHTTIDEGDEDCPACARTIEEDYGRFDLDTDLLLDSEFDPT